MFGGYDGHNRLHFVERYDPREANADCVAKMIEYRVGASAVAHNGSIYVAGGCNKGIFDTDTVEMFVCISILFLLTLQYCKYLPNFGNISLHSAQLDVVEKITIHIS